MKFSRVVLITVASIAMICCWLRFKSKDRVASAQLGREGSDKAKQVELDVLPIRYVGGASLFSREYGSEGTSPAKDLVLFHAMVSSAFLVIKDHDRYLLGDNSDVIAFLQGRNRDRLAWLPTQHEFINRDGELLDRWQTPLFFHQESGLKCQLRSAGPDKKMWTDDDLLFPETTPQSQTP